VAGKNSMQSPDGNLILKHIHGCSQSKMMIKYVNSGYFVFAGAAVGIKMNIDRKT